MRGGQRRTTSRCKTSGRMPLEGCAEVVGSVCTVMKHKRMEKRRLKRERKRKRSSDALGAGLAGQEEKRGRQCAPLYPRAGRPWHRIGNRLGGSRR